MVTAPAAAPAAVGQNSTLRVQLAPGASEVSQLPIPPNANGPLMVMLPNFNWELLKLVTLGYCSVLVVPTVLAEKLNDEGVNFTRGEED